jgi:hypothetical protein
MVTPGVHPEFCANTAYPPPFTAHGELHWSGPGRAAWTLASRTAIVREENPT